MIDDNAAKQITEGPSWTLATLHDYLVSRSDERDRGYQQRWEASEKATGTALIAAKEAVAMALQAQKEAVATAFIAQEKAVAAALSAAERAVTKAEQAAEKRFDSVNEFRAQLSDQASTFLPRAEFNRALDALVDKMDATDKAATARIDDLRTSRDASAGRVSGMNAGWGYLLGTAAFANVLLGVFIYFKK